LSVCIVSVWESASGVSRPDVNSASVEYTPRLQGDRAYEPARNARARAWAFVFECHAKKEAARGAHPDGRDNAGGSENDCAATKNCTG
jgi:hypothetical protein